MKKSVLHAPPPQSTQFVPLSGSLHDIQIPKASFETLRSRVGEPLTKKITEAYTILARAGYQHEAEAMLAKIREPGPIFITTTRPSSSALSGDERLIAEMKRVSEQEKWSLSLRAWAQCVEHGREIAFTTLPFLLSVDCAFFLGQLWVRELIAGWYNQGDRKDVEWLFFGTGKRGVNRWHRTLEDFRRDLEMKAEVDRLLQEGWSNRAAFEKVGKPRHLSGQTVESAYRRRTRGYDPLAHLLSPS